MAFSGRKWLTCVSDEKNEKSKAIIRQKVMEYIQRAENLKDYLASQKNKKQAVAVGGSRPK
jgi:vacuolar protein-sorting-associated protein 4